MALLGRLQETEPDRFSRAHLRTLQRRVQQWRGIMADKLVYAASGATLPDPGGIPEMALVRGLALSDAQSMYTDIPPHARGKKSP